MPPDVDLERLELRRECERLRGENARLGKLLELRGGEAARIPEQAATASAPGAVRMASSVADKLALFSSLFRARTDSYAVRWENLRAGTKGWKPAVAGGWRKGMDRRTASPLPLTAQTVAAHLVGDVFIGLYPLLKDNSCHFLAADFDGPAAQGASGRRSCGRRCSCAGR